MFYKFDEPLTRCMYKLRASSTAILLQCRHVRDKSHYLHQVAIAIVCNSMPCMHFILPSHLHQVAIAIVCNSLPCMHFILPSHLHPSQRNHYGLSRIYCHTRDSCSSMGCSLPRVMSSYKHAPHNARWEWSLLEATHCISQWYMAISRMKSYQERKPSRLSSVAFFIEVKTAHCDITMKTVMKYVHIGT